MPKGNSPGGSTQEGALSGTRGLIEGFGAPFSVVALLMMTAGAAAVEGEAEDATVDNEPPAATASETETSLPSGPISLPPLSIYATRTPTAVLDYPGRVTVIDRDRIETLQPTSVFDVLEGVPGVQPQGAQLRKIARSQVGSASPHE